MSLPIELPHVAAREECSGRPEGCVDSVFLAGRGCARERLRPEGAAGAAERGGLGAKYGCRAGDSPGLGGALMLPGTPHIAYRNRELFIEGCALRALAAEHGTPRYVPSISAGLKDNEFCQGAQVGLARYGCAAAMAGLGVIGFECLIGSECGSVGAYIGALDRVLDLVEAIETHGIGIHHVD